MPIKEEIMPVDNNSLMSKSRKDLEGIWTPTVITFLVYLMISSGAGIIPFGSLLVAGPLSVGLGFYSLQIAKGNEVKLENIFIGFNNFANAIGTYFLMIIFIFLWSLLLIIPGIIASISYSQVFFILAEDTEKELDPKLILSMSKEMMKGHKMDYFILLIMFFGLGLLSLLTLGIALIWLIPFMQVTMANFYLKINGKKYSNELDEFLDDSLDLEDL